MAQNVFLNIVAVIKKHYAFEVFLSEPVVLTLVFRLATDFKKGSQNERKEISVFFANLLNEIQNNKIPFLLIGNIICNVIVVSNILYDWLSAISFIEMLEQSILSLFSE